MRLAVLVLLLTSCAAPQPTEFRQGAPVHRPPAFNPTTDAPHRTGHPGYVRPGITLPPSTNKRVLPRTPKQEAEPGIWAGDQPVAMAKPPGVQILDAFIPTPLFTELHDAHHPGPSCAERVDHAFTASAPHKRLLDGLTKDQRWCLLAALYGQCIAQFARGIPAAIDQAVALGKDASAMQTALGELKLAHDVVTAMLATKDVCRKADADIADRMARYNALPQAQRRVLH
jgi:hypothetical protein